MQGAFLGKRRPKFKKELKETIERHPEIVSLEATSAFGNEYGGPLAEAPDGTYSVVGPDPYRARNWYATIEVRDGTARVTA